MSQEFVDVRRRSVNPRMRSRYSTHRPHADETLPFRPTSTSTSSLQNYAEPMGAPYRRGIPGGRQTMEGYNMRGMRGRGRGAKVGRDVRGGRRGDGGGGSNSRGGREGRNGGVVENASSSGDKKDSKSGIDSRVETPSQMVEPEDEKTEQQHKQQQKQHQQQQQQKQYQQHQQQHQQHQQPKDFKEIRGREEDEDEETKTDKHEKEEGGRGGDKNNEMEDDEIFDKNPNLTTEQTSPDLIEEKKIIDKKHRKSKNGFNKEALNNDPNKTSTKNIGLNCCCCYCGCVVVIVVVLLLLLW